MSTRAASFALSLLVLACTPSEADGPPDGPTLFARANCALCHGSDGQGSALAPQLINLERNWNVAALVEYLADPADYAAKDERLSGQADLYRQPMPSFANLDEELRAELARFLLDEL